MILQHGGTYGIAKFSAPQAYEIDISDRFLSWGWTVEGDEKVVPAPAGKLLTTKPRKPGARENLLHIMGSFPRQPDFVGSWLLGIGVEKYFKEQLVFASSLRGPAREALRVRTYPEDYGWNQTELWREWDPNVQLDSNSPFKKSVERAKLVVVTYNATTYLQTFRLNVPTVLFWDPKYWELADEAQSFFDGLKKVGICFDKPSACAQHINEVGDSVEMWWGSNDVQTSVAEFCEKFARPGRKPLREFRKTLTSFS